MRRKTKTVLITISAIVVIAILMGAYFASQPKVKWWKPEKELEKPSMDFSKLKSTIIFLRTAKDNKSMHLVSGNESSDGKFAIYFYLRVKDFVVLSDFSQVIGNLTVWAERLSGDYILQKLVISYSYGSEKEDIYTEVHWVDTCCFQGNNLWYDNSPSTYPNSHDTMLWDEWVRGHKMVGVNKDEKDADFYGVSFPIEIFLDDSLSLNLTHTITFTVTAYYGHPSLLGWSDMHELKTQVVLKIVPEG